jgi:hypothetical protein
VLFHASGALEELGNPLIFTPVAMVLVTLVVAYLVAGQASPPVHQRRFWSRLLIAAMHILQPVERGFARYQTRFKTKHVSDSLYALSRTWQERVGGFLRKREIVLWSEDGQGREELLERLLVFARAQGANLRPDSGWEPHDVTFYGDRWCNLELTTVTENHGGGQRLTRIKTRLHATLFSYAILALTTYLMLLVWLWDPRWEVVMLAPLLGVAWVIFSSFRKLQGVVAASVFTVAEALGMTALGAPQALRKPVPAAEAVHTGSARP